MTLKRNMILARAELLNSQGALMVLASTKPELSGKECVAARICTACNTEFSSNPGMEPYCPNCGSEHVDEMPDGEVPEVPKTDEALVAIKCDLKECGTYNVLHHEAAKHLDGIMNCVACGSVLAYDNSFNDGGTSPADTRPKKDDDNKGTPADTRPTSNGKGTDPDTRPKDEHDVVRIEHSSDLEVPKGTGEGDKGAQQRSCADRPWREELADDDVTDVVPLHDSEEAEPEHVDLDFVPDASGDDQGPESATLMTLASVVMASSKHPTFGLIIGKNAAYATLDDVHVATLSKETAGEYADVLTSQSFGRAVFEVASQQGYDAVIKQFGFSPVKLKFPQSKVNAALVARKVQETASSYNDRLDEIAADMHQCISLAAAGLNRNFFKKHDNVLRKGFTSALASAGIKGADQIVAGVFDRFSDDYHTTLITVASELMSKSLDVRNELADAISQVNTNVVPDKGSDQQKSQEAQDDEDLEDRLHSSVTVVRSSETASMSSSSIGEIKGRFGKLF